MRTGRHILTLTLLVSAGALAVAACGAPSAPAPSAPAAPASAPVAAPAAAPAAPAAVGSPAAAAAPSVSWQIPTGPITVSFSHGTDATTNKLYTETLIPEYQKLHPNVTIKDEAVPSLDTKMLVALSSGTAPDMFTSGAANLSTLIAKKVIDPVPPEAWGEKSIDDLLQKHYIPGTMTSLMDEGKLYGIPNQMNAFSLFINNRLFKEAGLDPVKDAPKTWDDVAKLNQSLTKRNSSGQLVQKGFEFRYARPDQVSNSLQMLIYQAGGEVLRDGKPAFNSDAGAKALQIWKNVSVDPKVTQNTPVSPLQDFANEQDAMTSFGPNGGTFVEFINPNMKGNYTFVPVPQIDPAKPVTTITHFDMVVNAASSADNRKVAWDFIHFMLTQPELWLKATGQLQPMTGWFDTPSAKAIIPYLDVAVKDLSYGRALARTEHAAELDIALQRAVERVLYENQDPKASLDQAAADFNQALQK